MAENKKRLDLIDRNALLEEQRIMYHYSRIENAPAVDAVEVVHGRWLSEPVEFTYEKDIKCSVCGRYVDEPENYCPDCGAKMDGRNDDGTAQV